MLALSPAYRLVWQLTPAVVLSLPVFAIFLIRLPLVNDYMSFTSDMGSYLMTRNWVLGNDPTGQMPGHFRPPLVGAILVPFTWAWGDLVGSKLLAILSSVLFVVPFFFLAKRFVSPWVAFFASLVLISLPMYAQLLAGGYLALLAYGLLLLGLLAIIEIKAGRWRWWTLPPIIVLLAGLNQTTAVLFGITGGLLLLSSRGPNTVKAMFAMAVGVLLSLAWLPFYWLHTPGNNPLLFDAPHFLNSLPNLEAIGSASLILVAFLVVPRRMFPFVLPTLALLLMAQYTSADAGINNLLQRTHYILLMIATLGAAVLVDTLVKGLPLRLQQSLLVITVTGLVFLQMSWFTAFHYNAERINMLTAANLAALDWIRDNTPPDAKLYVHPNGLGWYVGGLVPRAWSGSWNGKAPRGFLEEQLAFNCAVGWKNDCDPYALRDLHGNDYILVDRSTFQLVRGKPEGGWAITAGVPWLRSVFEKGSVNIYAFSNTLQ